VKYAIDGERVSFLDDYFFSKPQAMPEADAATFESVGDWFAKDRSHVYFLYRVVDGADPESFVYLGGYNAQWAKDRARAYYFLPSKAAKQFWAIESASLDAFEVLPHGQFSEYARDREFVYHLGRRIRGADAPAFAILPSDRMGEVAGAHSCHFAADGKRVYFDGKPIAGAECGSFKVVHAPGVGNIEYGVDSAFAYCRSSPSGKVERITREELPAVIREYLRLG
jgi:hypothetical protein